MITSPSDFLILIIVAILLMGGDKNIEKDIKNFLKVINEFQIRRAELVNELRRELGDVTMELQQPMVQVTRVMHDSVSILQYNDRVKELEERIRILEQEIEKLRM